MCGIAGYAGGGDRDLLKKMADLLLHRGPDGEGFFEEDRVGLAHKRLSIIDLELGAQPLVNETGEIALVCNGEIYNFRELREELEKSGHRFSTNSDNEIIIHLYEDLGPSFISKLHGMFAFALWDKKKKGLLLARDRLGIKPLYYRKTESGLRFSSEIKALCALPEDERRLFPPALDAMLSFNQIPGAITMFDGIRKILPGHFLWWTERNSLLQRPFWSVQLNMQDDSSSWNEEYCSKNVAKLLRQAVESHMVSDVPVGATLSGGIDSVFVTALMVKASMSPVSTFTIGFGDGSDERSIARRVAEDLGTEHNEYTESYDELSRISSTVLWHMEEPLGGVLAPTYMLARRVRGKVKVVLVGEGSDEIFAGYNRFHVIAPPFSRLPSPVKTWAYQRGINGFTTGAKTRLYTSSFQERVKGTMHGEKKFSDALSKPGRDVLNKVLCFEQEQELPNLQLARVDKMMMAHSVEARVPFLDHRLVEYVNQLPSRFKFRLRKEKYLLRQAAKGIIPEYVIHRKKQAFSYPLKSMFGLGFRDWISDLLSPSVVSERGYFKSKAIDRLFRQCGGKNILSMPEGKLYNLAMVELWHRIFIDPSAISPPEI